MYKLEKTTFIFVLFLLFSLCSQGQIKTKSNHSIYLNLIGLSYGYEQSIGGKFSILGHAGLMTPYWGWASSSGIFYSVNPYIGIEPRFYYSLNKRYNKGENTSFNSANYLSIDLAYMFKPILKKDVVSSGGFLISPTWGLRRVFRDFWLLEFNLGVNCFISHYVGWSPKIDLKFGIVL